MIYYAAGMLLEYIINVLLGFETSQLTGNIEPKRTNVTAPF